MVRSILPPETHSTILDWRTYFERNRSHRQVIPWEHDVEVDQYLRAAVIRSLQRFQIGEQGDGKHLREVASEVTNPHYSVAIDLFIQEEQEHSRLLAGLLHHLKGDLLGSHWSDTCFIFLRRLGGLRVEVLTLLVAEIIAQVYYRVLSENIDDVVFRCVCEQIVHDEDGHVAFHCDFLHADLFTCPLWQRRFVSKLWHALFSLVCLVVICDHFSLLRALHVSPIAFWKDCQQMFARARLRLFG